LTLAAIAATCLSVGTVAPLALAQADPDPAPASPTLIDRADQLLEEHLLAILVAGLALTGYLGVLYLRPRWLLRLPSSDIALPWTKWKVPLTLVRPLKYRDRVLDAWVAEHWQTAQAEFLQLDTVKRKTIHIPLPVELDDTTVELGPDHLAPTFKKKPALLLITGEGGAGKTSLACQIARWGLERHLAKHRLLPVLIETDLDDGTTLLEAVRGLLTALTHQADPLPAELVEKLLHRQRILVIVDHLSEMGAPTRNKIAPHLADFPAKAMVITSRLKEQDRLGSLPKTTLRPLQIESNRLWPFMSAYLRAKGKQDLFDDDEYSSGSDRLRRMTADKSITALLACLYIDHMIRQREVGGVIWPDSVPRLMLSYLYQLNRSIEAPNKRDDLAVQRDAKAIAWACVQPTYRPNWIKKETAIAALAQPGEVDSAKARLAYLETRLQLLQSPDPGTDTRIILDPLAEYLAAAYLVDRYSQQDDPTAAWQHFFETLDQKLAKANESPEIVRGFLLALRDCCLDDAQNEGIPPGLADQLARKAQIDPEELRQAQETRRIRRLIFDLSEPDLKDRIRAAEELGNYGAAARTAEQNLVGMLENRSQPPQARQAAAETLGKLAIGETALLSLVSDPSEEATVWRSAAEALGAMNAGQEQLLSILYNTDQPLTLRQGAGRALRLMGAAHGETIPVLVVALHQGQATTQVQPIQVWQEPLGDQLTLDLVGIPGGEFLMGSPPDEVGRDVYTSLYPNTVGKDVEAQHRVTVESFAMGQFPVTQAQWQAVAALTRVNRELAPDPAHFKGDHRPVEQVSWYEAVEFCDRLSQHSGHPYRLPSEAEWEYACRAKTTTPFHFGDNLSTELANYNGNYTYGTGAIGEYRQATTAVGQFGVANAFGLFDLLGNVFEWCLDHWHPSYEGAPTDGSAWVTDGNEGHRIVRGGSWYNHPKYCRSASRNSGLPDDRSGNYGFRVVCSAPRTYSGSHSDEVQVNCPSL
jgi:formylglycine-generating enzyme required for sulfatase activity